MCGRFTLIRLADFLDMFPWIRAPDAAPPARYNIAPTQAVAAVANLTEPKIDFFHFGLIPSWAKDPAIGNRMINARAETLAAKPAFKTALRRRRCLVIADGFYEWRKNADRTKTPMYIRMRDGKPFAFAGLWDFWHDAAGNQLPSCTIITTAPNPLLANIHDRMPAIVRPEDYREWLAPGEEDPAELEKLLGPYPAEEMAATPVSPAVNSPKNDTADCIEGMTEERGAKTGAEDLKAKKKPAQGELF